MEYLLESRIDELTAAELAEAAAELEGERLKMVLRGNDNDGGSGKGLLAGIGRLADATWSSSGDDDGDDISLESSPSHSYYHQQMKHVSSTPTASNKKGIPQPAIHHMTPELQKAELMRMYVRAQAMNATSNDGEMNGVHIDDDVEDFSSSSLPCDDILMSLSRDSFEEVIHPPCTSNAPNNDA